MNVTRTVPTWLSLLALGATTLVACTPGADSPEVTDQAESALEAQAPEAEAPRAERGPRPGGRHARGPGRGHHGGGPIAIFRHALDDLDLDDAQRAAIDAELEALDAERPERGERRVEHGQKLAAAVRAGSIDVEKLQAELGAPPHEAMRERMQAAVAKLHATLRPEQRKALSEAVLAKMDAKAEQMKGLQDRAADDAAPRGPGRGGKGGRGPLGHLLGDLELDDAQRAKLDAALEALRDDAAPKPEDHEARHQAMRAAVEAFAGDRFDPASFAPPPAHAGRGPGRIVEALAVIVPVLNEAQREQLAKRLEQGPPERGERGRRGPPRGAGPGADTTL